MRMNLAKLFEKKPNQIELWVSNDDAHPTSIAHKAIAESAFEFISNRAKK